MSKSRRPHGDGASMGAHLRREYDVLVEAKQGLGAASLFHAISVQAAAADDGTLEHGTGTPGYAWQPDVYQRKSPTDPVGERIRAVSASFGRVMAGGHPTTRAYLAFMEGIYRVTTDQPEDVTKRIEAMWDDLEREPVLLIEVERDRPSWWRRVWETIRSWWNESYGPTPEGDGR